ncbi:MAG: hypothetical protein AAF317_11185, partial [Pseudomonadota bacterium]
HEWRTSIDRGPCEEHCILPIAWKGPIHDYNRALLSGRSFVRLYGPLQDPRWNMNAPRDLGSPVSRELDEVVREAIEATVDFIRSYYDAHPSGLRPFGPP